LVAENEEGDLMSYVNRIAAPAMFFVLPLCALAQDTVPYELVTVSAPDNCADKWVTARTTVRKRDPLFVWATGGFTAEPWSQRDSGAFGDGRVDMRIGETIVSQSDSPMIGTIISSSDTGSIKFRIPCDPPRKFRGKYYVRIVVLPPIPR
jgi:hypothetical protein